MKNVIDESKRLVHLERAMSTLRHSLRSLRAAGLPVPGHGSDCGFDQTVNPRWFAESEPRDG